MSGRLDRATLSGAGFLLIGTTLIQCSAGIVTRAFPVIGPSATSAWRFTLGALMLLALTRPNLRHWSREQWWAAIALGVSTAFLNQCFYQAIARIPLGGAVAIEYLGPFTVAVVGKRTPRHLALTALAAIGVLALTRPGGGLDGAGVLFAAGSGLGWAAYVFASRRVGGTTPGLSGLAVSMAVAAVVTLPFSLGEAGRFVESPGTIGRVAVVAALAVVAGFGAELQGLRRLKPAIAGVLLASDPAIAFLVGWALLSQAVRGWDFVGLSCVMVAGALVTLDSAVGPSELAQ